MLCAQCLVFYGDSMHKSKKQLFFLGRVEQNQVTIAKILDWFPSPLVLERRVCNRREKCGGSDSLCPFQLLRAQKKETLSGENEGYGVWMKVICCW